MKTTAQTIAKSNELLEKMKNNLDEILEILKNNCTSH